jgi:BirA family transcriptional regulator, biotin operon repressor / biotin---[acetyl-CoA-carboxylase] ligase
MPLPDFNCTWERFTPDRVIGAHVLAYDEVDSTMDVARQLADAGASHGTTVRAGTQRVGRGRFARRWESAPGDSLLLSVVLRMPPLAVDALVSVAGALAVRDSVASLLGKPCAIKWPNDVQVDGKKIAGVLVESQVATDGTGFAILGLGFNVNLDPQKFKGIAETATSLAAERGRAVDIDEVENLLLKNLDEIIASLIADSDNVLERWSERLSTIGQQIAVHGRDGVVSGEAVGVDEHGALLLRDKTGVVHTLPEGDVTLQA